MVKYTDLDFVLKLTLFPLEIYSWFSVAVGVGVSPRSYNPSPPYIDLKLSF